jgi:hypothetical protein
MAVHTLRISAPREEVEALLQAHENPPLGFLIAVGFQLLLDIRELLIGLNQASGAREGTSSGIIVP